MMITEIGIIAGEIWHFLDENGQVTLGELINGIDKPDNCSGDIVQRIILQVRDHQCFPVDFPIVLNNMLI